MCFCFSRISVFPDFPAFPFFAAPQSRKNQPASLITRQPDNHSSICPSSQSLCEGYHSPQLVHLQTRSRGVHISKMTIRQILPAGGLYTGKVLVHMSFSRHFDTWSKIGRNWDHPRKLLAEIYLMECFSMRGRTIPGPKIHVNLWKSCFPRFGLIAE